LISLALSVFIAFRFGKWIAGEVKLPAASNLFWILALFFWCSSFLMVRFSSENFGGLAFIGGILLVSDSKKWIIYWRGYYLALPFNSDIRWPLLYLDT